MNFLIFVKSLYQSQAVMELADYLSYSAYVSLNKRIDIERALVAEYLAAKTDEEIRALKPSDPGVVVNGNIVRLTERSKSHFRQSRQLLLRRHIRNSYKSTSGP